MKHKIPALLLAATALAGTAALAQTAAPTAPAAPAKVVPLAQAQPSFDPAQLPATRGSVRFFTLTPRGDVDGFLLSDGTQVHVPPHLSTQLVAAVRLGDAVTVRGLRAAAVPLVVAMAVTNDASNQTVVDTGPAGGPPGGPMGRPGMAPPPPPPGRDAPPPPPPAAAQGPQSEVSGRVLTLLHGRRGEVNGAMLEDGTALRMPPHEAERLAAQLAPGQTVVARGFGLANGLGRVLEVRAIGASADALTTLQAPPPPPPPRDGQRPVPPPR